MLWLNSERGRNEFVGSEGKAKCVVFLIAKFPFLSDLFERRVGN